MKIARYHPDGWHIPVTRYFLPIRDPISRISALISFSPPFPKWPLHGLFVIIQIKKASTNLNWASIEHQLHGTLITLLICSQRINLNNVPCAQTRVCWIIQSELFNRTDLRRASVSSRPFTSLRWLRKNVKSEIW